MDIAFVGLKDKFVLICLGDLIVYSHSHDDHLQHLRKVFLKCRRYGISLNPMKSQFALNEENLLGHIVSAEGVKIDLVRVEAIQHLVNTKVKKRHSVLFRQDKLCQEIHSKFIRASKAHNNHAKKGCRNKVD